MMRRIIFISLISLFLYSCPDDEPIEVIDTGTGVKEPTEDQFVIDSFLWAVPVDTNTIRNKFKYLIPHVLLHEDLVLSHVPDLEGWVALDAKTGETVWDNRGQLNDAMIVDKPIQYGDHMYYTRTSSFLKLNMNTGVLELKELWPPATEFQRSFSTLHDGMIYTTITDFNNAVPDFEEWIRISVDEIVSPPLNWTRFNKYESVNHNGIVQGSGDPLFFNDTNGHENMVYPSNNRTANLIQTVSNTVTSYDLEADSIKWRKEVGNFGGFQTSGIIEEDRLYFLVGNGLICLSAETGDLLWEAKPDPFDVTYAFGAGIHIVGNNLVAISIDRKTVGLNKFTGDRVWLNDYDANHPDRLASGSQEFSLGFYNGRIYYISGWGQLISLNPSDGTIRRFYLPDRPVIEEYGIQLFEPSFRHHGMTISDDGIIYLSEGLRFLALEVPDKDW